MKLPGWLNTLFGTKESVPSKDIEALRNDFRSRYHHFQLLLTANNKVLDIMSEMNEALTQNRPLGMSFVHSRCTRVAANCFRVIKHLDELAPDKYKTLFERFKAIQEEIDPLLAAPDRDIEIPMVLPLEEIDKSHDHHVGGKMANLGELNNRLNLKVPPGFVLTKQAYWRFMDHHNLQAEIREIIQSSGSESIEQLQKVSEEAQQLIIGSELPEDLEEAMLNQYRKLEAKEGKDVSVVARSSALREDARGMSFAGQYLTEFNVTSDTLPQAYKRVIASKYSIEAITYRRNRGVRNDSVSMCVGCMPVIDSLAGGVAYSQNPLDSNDKNITIHSVWGLPTPVADGILASDLFVVTRQEPLSIIQKEIPDKKEEYKYGRKDGICRMEPTGRKGSKASLKDNQVLELAHAVLSIEKHYGAPQDVEWALDHDGSIVFLQARQLKQKSLQHTNNSKKPSIDENVPVVLEGGVTVSPGAAAGPVFVVKTEKDIINFPEGGVLVTAQALPYWAVLLNRTASIITEHGNVAGHLATVARELNVPALFSVEGATKKLENGQIVTVDADATAVYEGKIESLIHQTSKPPVDLLKSPVYKVLESISQKVLPLNLIDPQSVDFRPRNCTTLHDITRFCHEKAVREMFQFGIDHKFPERASKRLFSDVPTQFSVIDLDDGFKETANDPHFITLDEIVSIPMLALWRGMMAIPWEGPPPVDGKGFFGVLMGSASNPALNPSMPSAYLERNYFMISKNFCSLYSRFGYHFSSVETLVGDREVENYISFQFNGGAASLERRIRRTQLVLEILEIIGFRTFRRQDNVKSRIDGYEKSVMAKRLEALGYLMFHTRQLDMVMNSESSLNHYKKKILTDLESLDISFSD